MRSLKIISVILSLLLLLCSCSANETELEKGGNYLFITGKSGGTYNSLGTAMASIVDKYLSSKTTIISSTEGSFDNIENLAKGDAEFAFCQSDIYYYAVNGKEMYKDNPRKGLSVMANLYTESVQIVVSASSDIETVNDLVGRSVAVGPYGSATEAAARQILEAYGISYDDITVRYQFFKDAQDGLTSGSIDAIFAVSAMPSTNIAEYAETHNIRFLPISTQVASKLKKSCPFFSDGVILSETYGTSNSVSTLNIDVLLICRSDISDITVYSIVKTLFTNLDELSVTHAMGGEIYAETGGEFKLGGYHNGAKLFFDNLENEIKNYDEPIPEEEEPEIEAKNPLTDDNPEDSSIPESEDSNTKDQPEATA